MEIASLTGQTLQADYMSLAHCVDVDHNSIQDYVKEETLLRHAWDAYIIEV